MTRASIAAWCTVAIVIALGVVSEHASHRRRKRASTRLHVPNVSRVTGVMLCAAVFGVSWWWMSSPIVVPIAGVVLYGWFYWRWQRRDKNAIIERASLASWLDAIRARLFGGATLHGAIMSERVGSPAGVNGVYALNDKGQTLPDALDAWSNHDDTFGPIGSALAAALRSGSGATFVVEQSSAALRQRNVDAAELAAQGAQARASASMMFVLPIVFLAGTSSFDSGVARFVFHSVGGTATMTIGLALIVAGAEWMRRLQRMPI